MHLWSICLAGLDVVFLYPLLDKKYFAIVFPENGTEIIDRERECAGSRDKSQDVSSLSLCGEP